MALQMPMISAVLVVYFSLMGVLLTGLVIAKRIRLKVANGDGGKPEMNQAIRAHGNFCEQTPLALIEFIVAEVIGCPTLALQILACLLVFARVLAAWGISKTLGVSKQRFLGSLMTSVYNVSLALVILYSLLSR